MDTQIFHDQPLIRGTRIPVAIIVGSLTGGMSFEEIEAEYNVTQEDILVCPGYAAWLMTEEHVLPTGVDGRGPQSPLERKTCYIGGNQ